MGCCPTMGMLTAFAKSEKTSSNEHKAQVPDLSKAKESLVAGWGTQSTLIGVFRNKDSSWALGIFDLHRKLTWVTQYKMSIP